MKKTFYILFISLFIFSCDSNPLSPLLEICVNEYSNVDGSVISCNSECSLIEDNCFYNYDIGLLDELRISNESLSNLVTINVGEQTWIDGRLKVLNLSNLEINYLPFGFCNIDCEINVSNNELCDEFQYDCIDVIGSQLIDECPGYTEYSNQWYYDSDLEVLQDFQDLNPSLNEQILLGIGEQNWFNGRLIEFVSNGSSLNGQIPHSIGDLTKLQLLDLDHNLLTGEIPIDIGNLTNLTSLSLYDNQLTGEIPFNIGNLKNLQYLYLDNNQLTGEIPLSIGNLTDLKKLYLGNNELVGEIPIEIGNLTNLTYLNLFSNQLTGSIPIEIGNLINLEELWLSSNNLTGEIPVEIGNLTNLEYLWLSFNNLTGEIPVEIGNLTNLENLSLGNNQLSGQIPEEICNQGDSSPNTGNNQLCPPYPSCISQSDIDSQDTSNCP